MTSTNDGKDVKSNQTSGHKSKTYYIELYTSLEKALSSGGSLEERTTHVCEAWRRVYSLYQHSAITTHPHLLSWLQRHTANTVLQSKWAKSKNEHTRLTEAIDSLVAEATAASEGRQQHPWEQVLLQRAAWFRKALENPWDHPVLTSLINPNSEPVTDEQVLEWLISEHGVVLVTRLQRMAGAGGCDDLALSLAAAVMDRARAAIQHRDEKADDRGDQEDSTSFVSVLEREAGFTSEEWDTLTDIELVLLLKTDKKPRCIDLAKLTPLRNGYKMVERLRKRLETSPRDKKLWKHAKEVATIVTQVLIARCMMLSTCAGAGRDALYWCARSLARLVEPSALRSVCNALAAPAATARHLHTFCAALSAECKELKTEVMMKPFICELYVRAITAGMNELEQLKLNADKEPEARLYEQTLAGWFTQLGVRLADSVRLRAECALTAFSVHPARKHYERVANTQQPPPLTTALEHSSVNPETSSEYGSWANDSRTRSNLVKTSETLQLKQSEQYQYQANTLSTAILTEGEQLGLEPELCQDLAVLLSRPRVKTLSWDMDREVLLEYCRTYMDKTHGGTKAVTTELKYLNLDPNAYQHLPEEEDDENDLYYGIEKGYEHEVQFEEPEEIWQHAFLDPEQTESANESEVDQATKKKNKTFVADSDEEDPLSSVADAKREKKKRAKEKDKEPRRKKTHKKDDNKEIKEKKDTDGSKEKKDKEGKEKKEKKPKKERKKDKSEQPAGDAAGSLNSLLGLKVTKIAAKVQDKEKKVRKKKERRREIPQAFFNYVNVDGEERSSHENPNVLVDGVFSIDDIRSPERLSVDSQKSMNKSKLKTDIQNPVIKDIKTRPVSSPRVTSNDSDASRCKSSYLTLNQRGNKHVVSSKVKSSLSKLLQFRRNQYKNTVPRPPPSHTLTQPTKTLVGMKIYNPDEVPKTYLNRKQLLSQQLEELSNDVNNLSKEASNMLAYSPKTPHNDMLDAGIKVQNPQNLYAQGQSTQQQYSNLMQVSPKVPDESLRKGESVHSSPVKFPQNATNASPSVIHSTNTSPTKSAEYSSPHALNLSPLKPTMTYQPFHKSMQNLSASFDQTKKPQLINDPHYFSQQQKSSTPQVSPRIISNTIIKPPIQITADLNSSLQMQNYFQPKFIPKGLQNMASQVTNLKSDVIRYGPKQLSSSMQNISEVPGLSHDSNKRHIFTPGDMLHQSNRTTPCNVVSHSDAVNASQAHQTTSNTQNNQSPSVPNREKVDAKTQQKLDMENDFDEYLRKLVKSIKNATAGQEKQIALNKDVKVSIQPPSTSANRPDSATSQSAKQLIQQKKSENAPNTFSRLSYMHKNKQSENKVNITDSVTLELNKKIIDYKMSKAKCLKNQVTISRVGVNKSNTHAVDNMIRKIDQSPRTQKNSPLLTSMLDSKPSKIPSFSNTNISQNYPDIQPKREDADLLLLLRQQTVSKPNMCTIDKLTNEITSGQISNTLQSNLPHTTPQTLLGSKIKNYEILNKSTTIKNSSSSECNKSLDWKNVLDAIRAQKTEPLGPNALDLALKQDQKRPQSSSRAQAIDKSNLASGQSASQKPSDPKKLEHHSSKGISTSRKPSAEKHPELPKTSREYATIRKEPTSEMFHKIGIRNKSLSSNILRNVPHTSVTPNSDFDNLDDLIDDDLRRELGEISSDEETYSVPNASFIKGKGHNNIPKNPTLSKAANIITEKVQSPKVIVYRNETDLNMVDNRLSGVNTSYATGYPNVITSNSSLTSVSGRENSQTAFTSEPARQYTPSSTTIITNQVKQDTQQPNNIVTNRIETNTIMNNVVPSSVIIASMPQPQPVVVIRQDLLYQPYPTISIHESQVTAELCAINQNMYAVNAVPNLAVYQTTQFAAPIISSVIIGNATTKTNASNPTANEHVTHEPLKDDLQIDDEENVSLETALRLSDAICETPEKSTNVDFNMNRNCDKNVLSPQVQENLCNDLAKDSHVSKLPFEENSIITDQDKKRIKLKRQSLINRNINQAGQPPIALTYAPLKIVTQGLPKNGLVKPVPKLTLTNIDDVKKCESVIKRVENPTSDAINENIKTADQASSVKVNKKTRRIWLRSAKTVINKSSVNQLKTALKRSTIKVNETVKKNVTALKEEKDNVKLPMRTSSRILNQKKTDTKGPESPKVTPQNIEENDKLIDFESELTGSIVLKTPTMTIQTTDTLNREIECKDISNDIEPPEDICSTSPIIKQTKSSEATKVTGQFNKSTRTTEPTVVIEKLKYQLGEPLIIKSTSVKTPENKKNLKRTKKKRTNMLNKKAITDCVVSKQTTVITSTRTDVKATLTTVTPVATAVPPVVDEPKKLKRTVVLYQKIIKQAKIATKPEVVKGIEIKSPSVDDKNSNPHISSAEFIFNDQKMEKHPKIAKKLMPIIELDQKIKNQANTIAPRQQVHKVKKLRSRAVDDGNVSQQITSAEFIQKDVKVVKTTEIANKLKPIQLDEKINTTVTKTDITLPQTDKVTKFKSETADDEIVISQSSSVELTINDQKVVKTPEIELDQKIITKASTTELRPQADKVIKLKSTTFVDKNVIQQSSSVVLTLNDKIVVKPSERTSNNIITTETGKDLSEHEVKCDLTLNDKITVKPAERTPNNIITTETGKDLSEHEVKCNLTFNDKIVLKPPERTSNSIITTETGKKLSEHEMKCNPLKVLTTLATPLDKDETQPCSHSLPKTETEAEAKSESSSNLPVLNSECKILINEKTDISNETPRDSMQTTVQPADVYNTNSLSVKQDNDEKVIEKLESDSLPKAEGCSNTEISKCDFPHEIKKRDQKIITSKSILCDEKIIDVSSDSDPELNAPTEQEDRKSAETSQKPSNVNAKPDIEEDNLKRANDSLPKIANAVDKDKPITHMRGDIKIEELPIPNCKDPNKKRVRIKLPNGKVFKATIYGAIQGDFDSLFSQPSMKAILAGNSFNDGKRYTVNYRQIQRTLINDPTKKYELIQDLNIKEAAIPSVNLCSDDEDEVPVRSFSTEFGKYHTSIDQETINIHQKKFDQKCEVKLLKQDLFKSNRTKPKSKTWPSETSSLQTRNKSRLISTQNNVLILDSNSGLQEEPTFPIKLANDTPVLITNDVIEIDDSSNDSLKNQALEIGDNKNKDTVNKIATFANLLLKDLAVETEELVKLPLQSVTAVNLKSALLQDLGIVTSDIPVLDITDNDEENAILQDIQKQDTLEKPENVERNIENEIRTSTYEDLYNLKECVVKLVKCEKLIKKHEFMKHMKNCYVTIERLPTTLDGKTIDEEINEIDECSTEDLIQFVVEEPSSPAPLSRCSSLSILNNWDDSESVPKRRYCTSPVMEIYDTLLQLQNKLKTESVKESSKFGTLTCESEWAMTKLGYNLQEKSLQSSNLLTEEKGAWSPSSEKSKDRAEEKLVTECKVPKLLTIALKFLEGNSHILYKLKSFSKKETMLATRTTANMLKRKTEEVVDDIVASKVLKLGTLAWRSLNYINVPTYNNNKMHLNASVNMKSRIILEPLSDQSAMSIEHNEVINSVTETSFIRFIVQNGNKDSLSRTGNIAFYDETANPGSKNCDVEQEVKGQETDEHPSEPAELQPNFTKQTCGERNIKENTLMEDIEHHITYTSGQADSFDNYAMETSSLPLSGDSSGTEKQMDTFLSIEKSVNYQSQLEDSIRHRQEIEEKNTTVTNEEANNLVACLISESIVSDKVITKENLEVTSQTPIKCNIETDIINDKIMVNDSNGGVDEDTPRSQDAEKSVPLSHNRTDSIEKCLKDYCSTPRCDYTEISVEEKLNLVNDVTENNNKSNSEEKEVSIVEVTSPLPLSNVTKTCLDEDNSAHFSEPKSIRQTTELENYFHSETVLNDDYELDDNRELVSPSILCDHAKEEEAVINIEEPATENIALYNDQFDKISIDDVLSDHTKHEDTLINNEVPSTESTCKDESFSNDSLDEMSFDVPPEIYEVEIGDTHTNDVSTIVETLNETKNKDVSKTYLALKQPDFFDFKLPSQAELNVEKEIDDNREVVSPSILCDHSEHEETVIYIEEPATENIALNNDQFHEISIDDVPYQVNEVEVGGSNINDASNIVETLNVAKQGVILTNTDNFSEESKPILENKSSDSIDSSLHSQPFYFEVEINGNREVASPLVLSDHTEHEETLINKDMPSTENTRKDDSYNNDSLDEISFDDVPPEIYEVEIGNKHTKDESTIVETLNGTKQDVRLTNNDNVSEVSKTDLAIKQPDLFDINLPSQAKLNVEEEIDDNREVVSPSILCDHAAHEERVINIEKPATENIALNNYQFHEMSIDDVPSQVNEVEVGGTNINDASNIVETLNVAKQGVILTNTDNLSEESKSNLEIKSFDFIDSSLPSQPFNVEDEIDGNREVAYPSVLSDHTEHEETLINNDVPSTENTCRDDSYNNDSLDEISIEDVPPEICEVEIGDSNTNDESTIVETLNETKQDVTLTNNVYVSKVSKTDLATKQPDVIDINLPRQAELIIEEEIDDNRDVASSLTLSKHTEQGETVVNNYEPVTICKDDALDSSQCDKTSIDDLTSEINEVEFDDTHINDAFNIAEKFNETKEDLFLTNKGSVSNPNLEMISPDFIDSNLPSQAFNIQDEIDDNREVASLKVQNDHTENESSTENTCNDDLFNSDQLDDISFDNVPSEIYEVEIGEIYIHDASNIVELLDETKQEIVPINEYNAPVVKKPNSEIKSPDFIDSKQIAFNYHDYTKQFKNMADAANHDLDVLPEESGSQTNAPTEHGEVNGKELNPLKPNPECKYELIQEDDLLTVEITTENNKYDNDSKTVFVGPNDVEEETVIVASPSSNVTDEDLDIKGFEFEDVYIFPLSRAGSSNTSNDSLGLDLNTESGNVMVQDDFDDFHVKKPEITYSRKRKMSSRDVKIPEKRYRKSKNIDCSKQTSSSMIELAYSKEYKQLLEYCSSVKFSYSRPFHKECVELENLIGVWPLTGACRYEPEDVKDEHLFADIQDISSYQPDPVTQTFVEEITYEYNQTDATIVNPPKEAGESNFNMGFGEGSGRVIQILKKESKSNISAATLSDVKQSQPVFKSVDPKDCDVITTNNDDLVKKIRQHFNFIELRDRVRQFFKKSTVDLRSDWMEQNAKENTLHPEDFPFDLCSLEYVNPLPTNAIVQVVQVGQLPVSAAAQNPVTCDPRVTQVSDASPSQCSVDNSPNDDSQSEIKTEYTELTTADLTLPLQEYAQQNQTSLASQDINEEFTEQTISLEMEIKAEESPEIKQEPEERSNSSDTELHTLTSATPENVDYSYENNTPKSNANCVNYESLEHRSTEIFSQQRQPNGTTEKTDQIAHAMNAAGITTTPETVTATRAHALVNILSQKIRQGSVNTTQTTTNTYSKTTSINAMALQQALAQILPPPLNQTGSSENNQNQSTPVGPQVLHIVQGKNASGNQITLVDNSQQSVISTPNTTQVLHIVQNKNATPGQASNGTLSQQTNSFSGLSLVDAGLQQGGNQLLHIVNTGNQKTANPGQLLKRVNLLTNLTNVQGSNEQKMVQFVCKSADGKAIQLNASHQRSMVLRLQPIETPNMQTPTAKPAESQELSPSPTGSASGKDSASQQEIKSRSIYEENYAKFIQNSSSKTPGLEKSTSLPKFNQAFGKPVFQEGNQKQGETVTNNSHLPPGNANTENSDCPANDNAINLEHIGNISSPPLLIRKPVVTSQSQSNIVQQIKQTIAPMNIQTMHGGVIYTRQIPVNIGGGQTINLITVPSTELINDDSSKNQAQNNQGEIEPSIIKIVPQSQTTNNNESSQEEGNNQASGSNDNVQTPQPQPVLTQMRIKLPMLSKAPQMVPGARVVRPSFFQIQRNVIGGANQPVYQQLVLTAAPPLGQQTIRLPAQATRSVKVPTESQSSSSESQMSSSTLEQLREFDMVLEQVKERSTAPSTNSSNSSFKIHTSSSDTTDGNASSNCSTESTPQVLYSIGNNQSLNVAYVNRKATVTTPTTSTYVRSPDSSGIADSPTSSTHGQIAAHTVTTDSSPTEMSQSKPVKVGSKSKSRPKTTSNPPNTLKLNAAAVPPKTSSQKPLEDEQTTQRILYILAEYKEQVENSPDKDKPAPRRRSNPPSNPGSSKRKKSSSSRRSGTRDMSPVHGEDTCRTMGSEDSSCGTSQGDCNESCIDSHSPQDSPRKVARKITFDQDLTVTQPRPQPQRNVIVADGQTITVARQGKPATAVLMPANYILPVSMVKGGQQIAIVTNRGPKLLTVGGEGGATNALLLQRLIGPAGLKPVLTRPGVRHVRLPTAALHNLQAFNLATATTVQPPDSTASPTPRPTPPELVDTRATSSPWTDRDDVKPERGSSPEGSEPWNLPADAHEYTYEETVRTDNMDRTVLVVQKKDGSQRQHRLAHVSAAALRHKYAILEHELRLQKSLSEECEDLGVDSPSASELFPEAELLFANSPAHEHNQEHHSHTPQPLQSSIPQPDMDDQIATDHLIPREIDGLGLGDVGIVAVSEDGSATIALDQEEFARSHPNTTFHSEPTEGEVQPFTITGLKGRHITSAIFHSNSAPATVLMTAPQATVISQAPDHSVKYQIENMINNLPSSHNNDINLSSVLVKDDGLTRFDNILTDSRELHLTNTTSAIVHSSGNATQVIRRVCYEDDKRERDARYLIDEPDNLIAGDDAKMIAEDSSRDATLESMADVDDDRSSPERHAELFWESNSASERSESRRPLDFSSDSDKCCKSPSFDETNSTDSSGVGTHMRLDSVIKEARGRERSGSADGSSADDTHPPLRTYPPKRLYNPLEGEAERSVSGKTRAGERSPDSLEVRRRASGRGVVKRGCHCCNGSPAPPRPKKPRQRKPTLDFNTNN